jgi:hypothetical protein
LPRPDYVEETNGYFDNKSELSRYSSVKP